jgi:hypothetical protein
VVTAELVLSDAAAPFAHAAGVDALARLSETLRGLEPVLGVVSAGDLLVSERRWNPGHAASGEGGETPRAGPREEAQEALDRLRARRGAVGVPWAVFATRDGRRARVSVILPMRGVRRLTPCFERLQAAAREAFPNARVELTGRYPLVLAAQRTLLGTLLGSLALTLAVVAGVFLLVLGSPRLTLRALVPNLLPVAIVLGAMGWLGVPLDSTTVMIAAVVLGLAVDDTLHTLGAFRGQIRRGPRRAVVTALERTVPAQVLTSGVLVLGFGICAFAGFLPIARFGALTAAALVAALAADLWLVPVLLAGASRRPDRRPGRRIVPPKGATLYNPLL